MNFKVWGPLIGLLFILFSCQKKELPSPVTEEKAPVTAVEPAVAVTETATNPEIEKGKRLYLSNCLQCHNRDPNQKGSIGPEIIDAPLEVMISKVMTGKYPSILPGGFVPKRKTSAMRPVAKLKDEIPLIWAYVQSVKKKK